VKILLARLRLIGDVVFTTPLIAGLRHHYPDAQLTYLVEPAAAPIVRDNPHLTSVIVAPHRRGLRRIADDLALGRRLRGARFDVAIDLHGGPRSAWLTWMSGAPMRVGYPIRGRSWMYTHVVARTPDLAPRHSVSNQWDLLTPLGIGAEDAARFPVEMRPDPKAEQRVAERLRRHDITPGANQMVVIHVSAGNPFRRWPADAFRTLAVQLARRDPSRRIILTSGPSDAAAARRIADAAREELGALAAAIPELGELELPELRALIADSAVYIGGDSGPAHLAATTTTPIVELLGPTLPERSRPWRDARWYSEMIDAGPLPCRPCSQRQCAPGDFRCLTAIAPERVVDAAERALARNVAGDSQHGAVSGDRQNGKVAGDRQVSVKELHA
jgi:lipopolysaccharide heptosyltransferase II